MTSAEWNGLAAVITAGGAVLVTIFNYLGSRAYGSTVKDMIGPVHSALSLSSTSMSETKSLVDRFMDRQASDFARITSDQGNTNRLLENLDERARRIETMVEGA